MKKKERDELSRKYRFFRMYCNFKTGLPVIFNSNNTSIDYAVRKLFGYGYNFMGITKVKENKWVFCWEFNGYLVSIEGTEYKGEWRTLILFDSDVIVHNLVEGE